MYKDSDGKPPTAAVRSVYGFPRHSVRWLASSKVTPAPRILSAKSKRFKAAWYFGQLSVIRNCLWTTADPIFTDAWYKGLDRLGCPKDKWALGILGEPGREQKMVIVTPSSPWVIKIAIGPAAFKAIEREAHEYELLQASNWLARYAVPKVRRIGEDALFLERLEGEHPQWDDPRIHQWIRQQLVQGSSVRGIYHGDITPWNVIDSGGTYKLLDWENADGCRYTRPLHNVLDYILRGAAVKRVKTSRVLVVISGHLINETKALATYRDYRYEMSSHCRDSLSTTVDHYLDSFTALSRKRTYRGVRHG
jgi:hypothetical protein